MGTNRKKGQVAMMETLAVLIVVVVLIIFGVIMYFKATATSLQKTGSQLDEEEASILVASLVKMAEISCGDGCIDASRLYWLKENVNNGYYRNLFGKKKVVVEQVYPAVSDIECGRILASDIEYPDNCGRWEIYSLLDGNGRKSSSIISLYYPEIQEYRIGRLIVEVS